jgi:hypothetical protein
MKKEVIFAIIAGGLLGLLIAFGAWRINSALTPSNKTNNNVTPPDKNSANISIASPNNMDVTSTSPMIISGLAKVAELVLVSGETTDALALADNKGDFASEIGLIGGVNNLTAGFFNDKGDFEKQNITVVYSTEFAKITPPPMPTDSPTSSDSVRQKVQDKLRDAYNNPIAYLGTITDIAESVVQIKTTDGVIEQISTTSEPVVINSGKTVKEVKVTDLAIGDYIVAMGFTGNHVLTAKRILITTPSAESNKVYVSAKVEKVTKKDLTVINEKEAKSLVVLPETGMSVYLRESDKLTKIKFANIEVDDALYLIGTIENDKLVARTIFVIR